MLIVNQQPSSHPLFIQQHVSLASKTWFKTGGTAEWYAQPTTALEFQQCLLFAQQHELPIFVLGEGANILISDDGFKGIVIHPHLKEISFTQTDDHTILVTAGAGVSVQQLINRCLEHNASGLEEFSGIPGTVGGSVYINIHYFEFLLHQFLTSAQVIERATGQITTVDTKWFNFGYNTSMLQSNNYYLVNATFKLQKVSDIDAAYAKGRSREIVRHRLQRYPSQGTCGSFFRNFYPTEVTLESNGKKMIYVAYYLDKIGIKGALSVGDAIVSYQHANMIVNHGNATTTDIITLARTMQQLVKDQFGIIPQPECQLIGFDEYPLLK